MYFNVFQCIWKHLSVLECIWVFRVYLNAFECIHSVFECIHSVFECIYNIFYGGFECMHSVFECIYSIFMVYFNVLECIYQHCNWNFTITFSLWCFCHVHWPTFFFPLYTMTSFPTCYTTTLFCFHSHWSVPIFIQSMKKLHINP
jgi:hypothetical protein